MEQIIVNTFGSLGYFIVPIITALIASFLIEAINYYTPEAVKAKWVNLFVTMTISILLIFMFNKSYYKEVWDWLIIFLINISFATVFYYMVGRNVVLKVIGAVEKKINKEVEKDR